MAERQAAALGRGGDGIAPSQSLLREGRPHGAGEVAAEGGQSNHRVLRAVHAARQGGHEGDGDDHAHDLPGAKTPAAGAGRVHRTGHRVPEQEEAGEHQHAAVEDEEHVAEHGMTGHAHVAQEGAACARCRGPRPGVGRRSPDRPRAPPRRCAAAPGPAGPPCRVRGRTGCRSGESRRGPPGRKSRGSSRDFGCPGRDDAESPRPARRPRAPLWPAPAAPPARSRPRTPPRRRSRPPWPSPARASAPPRPRGERTAYSRSSDGPPSSGAP